MLGIVNYRQNVIGATKKDISIEVIGFALQKYILVHIHILFKITKFLNLILLIAVFPN